LRIITPTLCYKWHEESGVMSRSVDGLSLAIGVVMCCAVPARAQQAAATAFGSVDGYVFDFDRHELTGVEVFVLDVPRRTMRTRGAGAYLIDSIPAGPHLLGFRRLGVSPLTIPIDVKPNEVTTVDAQMAVRPGTLPVVVVQSSRGEFYAMPRDLAQRIRTGQGHYMDYDEIERRHAIRTSDLFSGIAGIEILGNGKIVNTRGVTTINATTCNGGLSMYLDGSLLTVADTMATVLDLVQPSEILAIEVYRSPTEVPATLPQSPCGSIFIWTKH
jgi:hypothetical protein